MAVKMPLDLAKRVERIASELGVTASDVVQTAIRQGLKQVADANPQRGKPAATPENG